MVSLQDELNYWGNERIKTEFKRLKAKNEWLKGENRQLKALLAAHQMSKTMVPGVITHPYAEER